MKKIFIASTFALLAMATLVSAQTATFNNNLTVGSSGTDVTNLQNWLISNGFDIPSVTSGATARGYFGTQTKNAVVAYQKAFGLPPTGYFGPMTRKIINNGSGTHPNPVSHDVSWNITSPNGGENWIKGKTQKITWTAPQYFAAVYVDITLVGYHAPCTTQICPMIAYIPQTYTVAKNLSINNDSYTWNVGNVWPSGATNLMSEAAYASVPDGQYVLQICQSGTTSCDTSRGPFTITSNNSSAKAPVINSMSAPTTLTVGQVGTWKVSASDPQYSILTYSIDWGDTSNCPAGYVCTANVSR